MVMGNTLDARSAFPASSLRMAVPPFALVQWGGKTYRITQILEENDPALTKRELEAFAADTIPHFLNAVPLFAKETAVLEARFTDRKLLSLKRAEQENSPLQSIDVETLEALPDFKTATAKVARYVGNLLFAREEGTSAASHRQVDDPLTVECGGGGDCAAYSLQYALDKKTLSPQAHELRTNYAKYLRDNREEIATQEGNSSLMQQIYTAASDATARDGEFSKQHAALVTKPFGEMSKEERLKLIDAFAAASGKLHFYLDAPFLQVQAILQNKPIVVINGPERQIHAVYYPSSSRPEITPANSLFIYFTGGAHYQGINKDSPQLIPLIQKYHQEKRPHDLLEGFLSKPTAESFDTLLKEYPHAALVIAHLMGCAAEQVKNHVDRAKLIPLEMINGEKEFYALKESRLVLNAKGECRQAMAEFWEELAKEHPDPAKLKATYELLMKNDPTAAIQIAIMVRGKQRINEGKTFLPEPEQPGHRKAEYNLKAYIFMTQEFPQKILRDPNLLLLLKGTNEGDFRMIMRRVQIGVRAEGQPNQNAGMNLTIAFLPR